MKGLARRSIIYAATLIPKINHSIGTEGETRRPLGSNSKPSRLGAFWSVRRAPCEKQIIELKMPTRLLTVQRSIVFESSGSLPGFCFALGVDPSSGYVVSEEHCPGGPHGRTMWKQQGVIWFSLKKCI